MSEWHTLAATPVGLALLASNGKYELARHLLYLNKKLLDLAARRITRLMVFMPPRHAKSTTVSHYFPAWYLMLHPDHRVMLTSYEADFAASWGRKARDVLSEWGPKLFGVQVRDDSSAADRWDIAGHAGGMVTAGAGGALTGRGADCLIIDDPVKNAEQALSPTYREHLWDWYLSTAYTRVEPGGIIIVTLTRWHEEDLAGKLLTEMANGGEQWEIVRFPALAEETDELGRQPGEALWPERYPVAALEAKRRTMENALWWAALYQQHPTPAKGNLFQRDWFTVYARLPEDELFIVQAIDSAFKEGVANDYSVIATWAGHRTGYYLLHVWRDRVSFPRLIAAIHREADAWHPDAILIEDAASGQSAIQTLTHPDDHDTRPVLPIVGITPDGSKVFRATSITPLVEGGQVFVPDHAPWYPDWLDEHLRFPRGQHDDQVDTTAMALRYLRRMRGGVGIAGASAGAVVAHPDRDTQAAPDFSAQAATIARFLRDIGGT